MSDESRVRACLAIAQNHLDDPVIRAKVQRLMVAVMLKHSDEVKSFEEELSWLDSMSKDGPYNLDHLDDEGNLIKWAT